MLLWDKKMEPARSTLAKLSQPQRLQLALACINDVQDALGRVFAGVAPEAQRKFFRSALALVSDVAEVSELPREAAGKLLESASAWLPDAPPGVWDMAGAMVAILQRAGGLLSDEDVWGIMSYAYQVVLHAQVLMELEREVTETEVQQMEAESPRCMTCISTQLQHIADAAAETH